MRNNLLTTANEQTSNDPFLSGAPPHWAARGLSYLLILLFGALVSVSILVEIPETISATFVLAPKRGADPVRALRGGVVQRVAVVEGQDVAQGEKLFVIRSEQAGDQSADVRSLETQVRSGSESLSIATDRRRAQQLSFAQERRKLQGRIEHLERQTELKGGELTMAREVVENFTQLRREGLASAMVLKDKQVEVSRLTAQLEQLRDEQRDARATIEKLGYEEEALVNEYRERERAVKEELETAKIRIAARSPWVAQTRDSEFVALAPCSGTILRLHVKANGAIVSDGEPLCEIACAGERLQAELQIPQAGIGRIRNGQGVRLMYDSFPYQQFGVKFGALCWISPTASTETFRAIAEIDAESVMVLGEPTPLKAGMAGRAEVVIAKRSLISFALDPIRRLRENLAAPPDRSAQKQPTARDIVTQSR
ncbi:MAG TPA: HlyD family efflux transporter periplasmic adaptor subunit [Blastocatellia bacterium]|nr:HlyD family efflux transporter periplasmic adaptor subunit [Blastocatellia bacterium]